METIQPLRLLYQNSGVFSLVDPRHHGVNSFDIISHRWYPAEKKPYGYGPEEIDGKEVEGHNIQGLTWDIIVSRRKIAEIKRFMIAADVEYLWMDCICIRQDDKEEKLGEMPKMAAYYKAAQTCHILLEMAAVWDPQQIMENLKFVGHVLHYMGEAALASQAPALTSEVRDMLQRWGDAQWTFSIPRNTVKAAAVDMGVLNCYSTSVKNIMSLFANEYFTRVWTFQEMILGKNVSMWAIDSTRVSNIGALDTWMDLAIEAMAMAERLYNWIDESRRFMSASVGAITRVIEEDMVLLQHLRSVVLGIKGARTDIMSGGPNWWYDNHKGISNIFSAIALIPRECGETPDIFRGLLGIFSGLFTEAEIKRDLNSEDTEEMFFHFFKQLSTKTEYAWTKLAVSTKERGDRDWIPAVEKHHEKITTECFAGVMRLGKTNPKGRAKAIATTCLKGTPQKFASIRLIPNTTEKGCQFVFKGCNRGKKVKTGRFSKEPIPINDQPTEVIKDETGKILVHCATVLGSLIDPIGNLVAFRRKLLYDLQPSWQTSDPSAKPTRWADRCVSGTSWENPDAHMFRVHNRSFNYKLSAVDGFDCQLATKKTATISCELEMNCGCTYIAPFPFIFQGLTAVYGSSLGESTEAGDKDDRIKLQDGSGLVQIGDIGRTFNLIAFDGDTSAYKSYAALCRKTKASKPALPKKLWPSGRALVSEEFSHGLTSNMRDYGFIDTAGSGNLLICRSHMADPYRILGVCIDSWIMPKKEGVRSVTIR